MNANYNTIDIADIESRLIILKRRAAEANFLREERDMLLNRLKLYTNDYVWPEIQADESSYNKLKEENKSLLSENEALNEALTTLENQVRALEEIKEELEFYRDENLVLKDKQVQVISLREEIQNLTTENENLKDDLETILQVINSDDPNAKCKLEIKRLITQTNELRRERDILGNALLDKNLKIDILLGKISHLEARLNEKYIKTKLKVDLGKELDSEEALLWTIQKLETANKMMGLDLSDLTSKFNAINEKYNELLEQTSNYETPSKSPKQKIFPTDRYEIREFSSKDYTELEQIMKWTCQRYDNYEERGSTGPPSPTDSKRSSLLRTSSGNDEERLLYLCASSKAINEHHFELADIKKRVEQEESFRKPHHQRFFSLVQTPDSLVRGSVLMMAPTSSS